MEESINHIHSQTDGLFDLPVAEEQIEEIQGGGDYLRYSFYDKYFKN
jgi:hypothetical protein